MELAAEDALRLNVLLANNLLAIRIDESKLVVHGLSAAGVLAVPLHPNGRTDRYLRCVRELFSSHVMDSPGGYPVFLKRWTRMGQAKDEHLERMLLLGEPEAVVAVVCAPGLTDEIARRAWWVVSSAENARHMLQQAAVAKGKMGHVLAEYLLDHLAFETDPMEVCNTVRLILQSGVIDEPKRNTLWSMANKHNGCRIGFLLADKNNVPITSPDRQAELAPAVLALATAGNPYARCLAWSFSPKGQGFLHTMLLALDHAENQEIVELLFHLLSQAFGEAKPQTSHSQEITLIQKEIQRWITEESESQALLQVANANGTKTQQALKAILLLASLNAALLQASFSRSSAIGASMRRKLRPVTQPIFEAMGYLLSDSFLPTVTQKRSRAQKNRR